MSDQPFGKLEPEFAEPYQLFRADPSPKNADTMLQALKPVIDKGLRAHVGSKVSPLTRSHARRITLQALESYDPAQAKLSTHVINHLAGLKRVERKQTHILKVPERVILDQRFLHQKSAEFEDEYGREPSTQELADFTGLSPKRIDYVRKFANPLATGQLSATSQSPESQEFNPAVQRFGPSKAWLELVYSDLNPTDQLIMEWTFGLHNKRPRSNQEIARRLGITPGAVSQRKRKIQQLLDQEAALSPFA